MEILYFILGGLILYVLGKIFFKSIKLIFKLILNSILGGILLIFFNTLGAGFGLVCL